MSVLDPGGELAKLLEDTMRSVMAAVSVAWPSKVLSFDAASGKATIQPLLQLTDKPPAPIQNVSVLGQRARSPEGAEMTLLPNLKAGDTVYVVCADWHMGQATTGQLVKPEQSRNHSRNDAVIVGVFPCCLQS